MAKNIIPQEDNTSEILQAELLQYSFLNRRQELTKNQIDDGPTNHRKWAIKVLEEERNNLVNDLNMTMNKLKMEKDKKYKAKFTRTINDTKKLQVELAEQKIIEKEIDKEIVRWKAELAGLVNESKKDGGHRPKLITNISTYNKLISRQNELTSKAESLLKRRQQKQNVYNGLMKKLNKGREITADLNEQTTRTYKDRNDAKERLDLYMNVSDDLNKEREFSLLLNKLRLQDDIKQTQFISQKSNKRKMKDSEQTNERNTEFAVLKAEAEHFVKHLICYAGDQNIANVTENIVKMDINNESMFELLVAIELYLTRLENAIAKSRQTVCKKNDQLSEEKKAKQEQLAGHARLYKDEAIRLNGMRCELQRLETQWESICRSVEKVCDLIRLDRSPLSRLLGDYQHPNRYSMVEYFKLMEHRVNEIVYWLYCAQDNCLSGVYEDLMSSGSEDDDFISKDLAGVKKKQPNILTKKDPTAMPVAPKKLHPGDVPTICPICVENGFLDDADEDIVKPTEMTFHKLRSDMPEVGVCNFESVVERNIDQDQDLKPFVHRNSDCPLMAAIEIKKMTARKRI
ncbi:uncharacterized protein LOC126847108 [Adelges cooleyi]|uniref:uncharacterized protein LOC126847108 n=1 Tax=Adelges cooleyi TaxID=133065 RepID=UPI00218099EA|nr:uncharacterized protein LOC126847108 [Adelges cooleyi]